LSQKVHELGQASGVPAEDVHRVLRHFNLDTAERTAEDLPGFHLAQRADIGHLEDSCDRWVVLDQLASPLLGATEEQQQRKRPIAQCVRVEKILDKKGEAFLGGEAEDLVQDEQQSPVRFAALLVQATQKRTSDFLESVAGFK